MPQMNFSKNVRVRQIVLPLFLSMGAYPALAQDGNGGGGAPFANILQIIENITSYLPSFMSLFGVLFFIIGTILVLSSLKDLSRRSEMGPNMGTYSPPIVKMIIGIFFVAYPAFENVLSQAFFGVDVESDPNQIFELAPSLTAPFTGEGGSVARNVVSALTAIIMFIGVIAIARGLYMLNLAAQKTQQVSMGVGFTFLIAGIMAANFPVFMRLVEAMVGA